MDFLFIIVLIFIAMTIFNAIGNNAQQKKEREQQEQRSRPGTGPPQRSSNDQGGNDRNGGLFGELRKQFDEMMNEEEHPTERSPRAEREVYREENTKTSDDHREYERERERLQRESREAKRRVDSTDTSPIFSGQKKQQRQTVPFGDLSGNNVVKGVIWSEVLGEPKSKRPHKTNRMI